MTKPQSPFGLRLPSELRANVSARAHANGRSLNAEICIILKEALSADLEKRRTPNLTAQGTICAISKEN